MTTSTVPPAVTYTIIDDAVFPKYNDYKSRFEEFKRPIDELIANSFNNPNIFEDIVTTTEPIVQELNDLLPLVNSNINTTLYNILGSVGPTSGQILIQAVENIDLGASSLLQIIKKIIDNFGELNMILVKEETKRTGPAFDTKVIEILDSITNEIVKYMNVLYTVEKIYAYLSTSSNRSINTIWENKSIGEKLDKVREDIYKVYKTEINTKYIKEYFHNFVVLSNHAVNLLQHIIDPRNIGDTIFQFTAKSLTFEKESRGLHIPSMRTITNDYLERQLKKRNLDNMQLKDPLVRFVFDGVNVENNVKFIQVACKEKIGSKKLGLKKLWKEIETKYVWLLNNFKFESYFQSYTINFHEKEYFIFLFYQLWKVVTNIYKNCDYFECVCKKDTDAVERLLINIQLQAQRIEDFLHSNDTQIYTNVPPPSSIASTTSYFTTNIPHRKRLIPIPPKRKGIKFTGLAPSLLSTVTGTISGWFSPREKSPPKKKPQDPENVFDDDEYTTPVPQN